MNHLGWDKSWGGAVRFDTGDDDYLGWIIAERFVPNARILEVLADDPGHPAFLAEEEKRRTPYCIRIIELDRKVHEGGSYETNSDYRRREVRMFETQQEAEAFLQNLGVAPDDLRDPREVDVP